VIGAALKRDVSLVPLPAAGLKLDAWSKRSAPCRLSRLCVQESCTNSDWYFVRSDSCQSGRRNVT
jgi:hypothetical protein